MIHSHFILYRPPRTRILQQRPQSSDNSRLQQFFLVRLPALSRLTGRTVLTGGLLPVYSHPRRKPRPISL